MQDSGLISRRASLSELDEEGEAEGLSGEEVKVSLRAMRESLRQHEDGSSLLSLHGWK